MGVKGYPQLLAKLSRLPVSLQAYGQDHHVELFLTHDAILIRVLEE